MTKPAPNAAELKELQDFFADQYDLVAVHESLYIEAKEGKTRAELEARMANNVLFGYAKKLEITDDSWLAEALDNVFECISREEKRD